MKFLEKAKIYFAKEQFEIFREIVFSILISAIVSTSVSYVFNRKIDDRATYRQFTYEFGRTFFDNPKYRNVSIAIEEQYLYGREDKISTITEYDLDDYLGLLSDMWSYHEDGYISKELFRDMYEYYYCVTSKSKLINDYRERLRASGFSETNSYSFLDNIATELNFQNKNCKAL